MQSLSPVLFATTNNFSSRRYNVYIVGSVGTTEPRVVVHWYYSGSEQHATLASRLPGSMNSLNGYRELLKSNERHFSSVSLCDWCDPGHEMKPTILLRVLARFQLYRFTLEVAPYDE